MIKFLKEALLQPFLAILFCLAFGVPFVHIGSQKVEIQGVKDVDGTATFDFIREYFWGLSKISEHLDNVKGADLKVSQVRRTDHHRPLVSGVFIITEKEAVALFAGSSQVNSDLKWETVESINEFLANSEDSTFKKTFHLSNVFGWVGGPFLVLGVLGLIRWPLSILRFRS